MFPFIPQMVGGFEVRALCRTVKLQTRLREPFPYRAGNRNCHVDTRENLPKMFKSVEVMNIIMNIDVTAQG